MTEDDWQHSIGGTHFIAQVDGRIVAHASVVERELHVAGRPLHTGYVEAVATLPEFQGSGHGSAVMRRRECIDRSRRTSWALWAPAARASTSGWAGRSGAGLRRCGHRTGDQPTPDEDGYIMVLLTGSTPPLDLNAPISCEWRPGDVW